ncbi:integral membrane protein [Sporocytophaga myxococcoides]|uniref:Integral membrane protein n=1 Tax=Sporocytophaga myxococcoides TaxID=153721 RepID=A0A098LJT5_9BACT|nr:DMT family transporter [Sporocytophaga myxococcoides]GAL86368.1 integral membrane protein [Sporocytophaga myxococcoides]
MSIKNHKNENLFLVGLVISMFCWGVSWTSGKIMVSYGNALNITLYRFFVTFISLFIIVGFTGEKLRILKKGLPDLICAALLIALYTYLFFKGLSLGKAGAGGVLVTTLNPIISYGIMLVYAKRKPGKYEVIGLAIGLVAGAFLLQVWNNWHKIWNAGNSYFVMATFTWAFLSLFTARSGRYGSPIAFSLWMYGICTVIIALISDYQESIEVFNRIDLVFWINLFFSATITTALATTFFFVATSRLGAGKASTFIFLVPFSAALGSWIFLKEVPEIHTIIGGLLGIFAVYMINRK